MATLSFNSRLQSSVSFFCGNLSPNVTYVVQVKGGSTWYDKAGPHTPSASGSNWTGAIHLDTTSSYSARLVANGIQVATATIPAYTPPVTTHTFRYTVYVYKYPTVAPYTSFTDSVKSTSSTASLSFADVKARAYAALGDSSYRYRAFSAASYCNLSSSGASIILNNYNQTAQMNFSFELPSYNYYIYWFDLKESASTPHRTYKAEDVHTSTYSFTAPTLTKTGYTFDGWCASASGNNGAGSIVVAGGNKITLPYANQRSLTLYAKWTTHHYSISFNANGGTGSMRSLTNCAYPTSYTLPANQFKRTQTITYNYGYSGRADSTVIVARLFSYWTCNGKTYADQALVQGLTEVNNGSVTMYAQWGNYSTTLPNPIRSGYTFKGWYDASGNYVGAGNSTLTGTTDRTLYAHWVVDVIAPAISYSSHTDTSITISLNRNGATSGSWVVEVSRSNSFGSLVTSQTISSTTQASIRIDGLSPNTTYYIRVRHVNGTASAASNTLMASTRISQFQWTSNDAVNIVAGQDFSTMILASKWNELIDKVNWCLQKSGKGTSGMSDVSAGSDMTAARFNAMRNAIASMNSSVVASKAIGDEIKAAYFANASSSLRTTINAIIVTL